MTVIIMIAVIATAAIRLLVLFGHIDASFEVPWTASPRPERALPVRSIISMFTLCVKMDIINVYC